MNRTENSELVMAVSALAAAFNREADQATFKAYQWGLDGMSIESIEKACIMAIRTCQYMPTPAELRELGGEASPKSIALLAWESFVGAVRHHGGNASVDFDDRTINAVVRNLGGWQEITLLAGEEFSKWLRHRFLDAYEKLSRVKLGGEMTAPLVGELANSDTESIRIKCLSSQQSVIERPSGEVKRLSESMTLLKVPDERTSDLAAKSKDRQLAELEKLETKVGK